MNSKGVIAIAVVVIVVVACVGVGVFFATKNGATVEKVRDGVKVGDCIEYDIITTDVKKIDGTVYEFLEEVYFGGGEPTGETKEFTVNGQKYTCEKYVNCIIDDHDAIAYVLEKGFVIQRTVEYTSGSITTTLTETNLDMALEQPEQVDAVKVGSYYKTDVRYGDEVEVDHATMTVTEMDSVMEIVMEDRYQFKETDKLVVDKIEGGNVYVEYNDDCVVMTAEDFRSHISLSDWKSSQKYEWKLKSEIDASIDTVYGKRDVKVGTFEVANEEGEIAVYELSYNSEGFIYKEEYLKAADDGMSVFYDRVLVNTNMRA